jgi:hypothetical protein
MTLKWSICAWQMNLITIVSNTISVHTEQNQREHDSHAYGMSSLYKQGVRRDTPASYPCSGKQLGFPEREAGITLYETFRPVTATVSAYVRMAFLHLQISPLFYPSYSSFVLLSLFAYLAAILIAYRLISLSPGLFT